MIYRTIALSSNSSNDGLDILFAEFQENAGQWNYEVKKFQQVEYPPDWKKKLEIATTLSAVDYQFIHSDFGVFVGQKVNEFINTNNLQYQVALVTYLGVSIFYQPGRMISQLGKGAAIAATTKLPVVSDLPDMDIILGGDGKFFQSLCEKAGLTWDSIKNDRVSKSVIIALAGLFRWREEYNFLSSVTGSARNTIGGAVWLGQDV